MYSYSKPGHFTWTATLRECGSLTNGGKWEDESRQCSECTSSLALGKSVPCVKKAPTGACTCKCLVLLAHRIFCSLSHLLTRLHELDAFSILKKYLVERSVKRFVAEDRMCTFTRFNLQESTFKCMLNYQDNRPDWCRHTLVDVQRFACALRHCLVIGEPTGWVELLSLPSCSWHISWILGNHMECLKPNLLFAFNWA